jgi:tRNA U34 5-methylaminomethyl-2-thiouridine-forming methyltransferase MnmC
LSDFTYPEEFSEQLVILREIAKSGRYQSGHITVELFLGDARKYVKQFRNGFFDIIYQDAFSPENNPALWTTDHFRELRRVIKPDGILTTYSIALKVRIALHENGFFVYLHKAQDIRSSTIASPTLIDSLELIDVAHKMRCNPETNSLRD